MSTAKPGFLSAEYARQFQDRAVTDIYRMRPPYPAQTFEILAGLLPDGNRHLLDLGAGTGEIAIPMARLSDSVTAVEPSAAMLRVAGTIPGGVDQRIAWINCSAEAFDYPRRYGLTTCAQCLGWMDWDVVFPRFSAALDDAGYLAIISQSQLTDPRWAADLTSLIAEYSTNQDFEPFNLIDGLIERNLFDPVGRTRTVPMPFVQSIDDFVESIHARNGFSKDRMAPDRCSAFDAAAKRLLRGYHNSGIIQGEITASVDWGKPLVSA